MSNAENNEYQITGHDIGAALHYKQQEKYQYNKNQVFINHYQSNLDHIINKSQREIKALNDNLGLLKSNQNHQIKNHCQARQIRVVKKYRQIFEKIIVQQNQNEEEYLINQLQRIQSFHFLYFIYLPTMIKVTLLGINYIDKKNGIGSVALSIELKVRIPGFQNHHKEYLQIFRKLKLKLKTSNTNRQNDIIVDFASHQDRFETQIWTNAGDYFCKAYKWTEFSFEKAQQCYKKVQQFQGLIFVARIKDVTVSIDANDLHAPFQLLDLQGIVSLLPLETDIRNWRSFIRAKQNTEDIHFQPRIVLKFNLLDLDSPDQEDRYFNQVTALEGIRVSGYDLAENYLMLEVGNKRYSDQKLHHAIFSSSYWKSKKERATKEKKYNEIYQCDSIAHYHFPVYKHPIESLAMIFIPTVVLGVINIFIFFQEQSLADQIANISTLLISFVAMIALIQNQIRRETMSISAILVYMIILTPLLTLFNALYFQKIGQRDKPVFNVVFWICVFITLLNCLYPIVMLLFFKFKLEPRYNSQAMWNMSKLRRPIMPGSDQNSLIEANKITDTADLSLKQNIWCNKNQTLRNFMNRNIFKHINQKYPKNTLQNSKRLCKKFNQIVQNNSQIVGSILSVNPIQYSQESRVI